MLDAFAPPGSDFEDRRSQAALLPWVRYCQYALWFCAVAYLVLGLGSLAFIPWLLQMDPAIADDATTQAVGTAQGVCILLVCVAVAVVNVVVALALGRGEKWGWIGALILGAIYAPSACLPIGAVILYGLLQDDVRKLYLG